MSMSRLNTIRPYRHCYKSEIALALGLIWAVALSFLGWLATSSASFLH